MTSHWTYTECDQNSDLEQGDILLPSPPLKGILKSYHSHFANDKYVGFMVATQSCDLVRRNDSPPKAPYITVAAIRPLESVAYGLLTQVANELGPGILRKEDKWVAQGLFQRIFNQNEQALGLFFLQEDLDSGIAQPSVALLRVTVALRNEHYQILKESRAGRLTDEFRAKLGWLLGNLFARPATRDWSEMEKGGAKKLEALVKKYVESPHGRSKLNWIEAELVKTAEDQGLDIAATPMEELEKFRPLPPISKAIDITKAELLNVLTQAGLEEEKSKAAAHTLGNRLNNNGKLRRLFKK